MNQKIGWKLKQAFWASLINDMVEQGLLVEMTGGRRNRLFLFHDYLELFRKANAVPFKVAHIGVTTKSGCSSRVKPATLARRFASTGPGDSESCLLTGTPYTAA